MKAVHAHDVILFFSPLFCPLEKNMCFLQSAKLSESLTCVHLLHLSFVCSDASECMTAECSGFHFTIYILKYATSVALLKWYISIRAHCVYLASRNVIQINKLIFKFQPLHTIR